MKTILAVIGPESSGTRVWEKTFAAHPDVKGTGGHYGDPLEDVWCATSLRDRPVGFPWFDEPFAVTRRSFPHGMPGKRKAEFMRFVDLDEFHRACHEEGHDVVYLVTSRAVTANLESCRRERSSAKQVGRKFCCVAEQYRVAYELIFDFLARNEATWWMLSLEALVYESAYLETVFQTVGLRKVDTGVGYASANHKRYREFQDGKLIRRDRIREVGLQEREE